MSTNKQSIQITFFSLMLTLIIGISMCACSNNNEEIEEPKVPTVVIKNDTLVLTPNESFFSPVGTLRAKLLDKTSGNEFNKNENYDYIYEWKALNDTILFGIDVKTLGKLTVNPEINVPKEQDGSVIFIYLDNNRKELKVSASGSSDTFKTQNTTTFENVTKGFHVLKFQIKSVVTVGQELGQLKRVYVSGKAANKSTYVMRRYRPYAVHCKWKTASTAPVEISVHEVTVMNTKVNSYQPIVTPFGYSGSAWSLKTNSFSGFNFSLWSYGANDPVPPFYQESHLIAVGPGLTFGAYGHEGTGVKPRGDHPYIGSNTNTQVIAIRKEPGKVYDTYWSYYLDPKDAHWKLYGCGKKYNKSGEIKFLTTGAFVEVPGPASKERSGHETREVQYRGWQKDTSGNWYPINQMVGTTKTNTLSFRDWRIVGNKFSMQMGGWGEPGIEKKTLTLNNPDPIPDYLKGAYLDELYKMPASLSNYKILEVGNDFAKLSFEITDLGTNASAEIFWGKEEGLTKEDKWKYKKSLSVQKGENIIKLNNLDSDTNYYYRIKITNDLGIIWSYNTQNFITK